MDKEKTKNWWYCDNLIARPDYVGILSLNFPRVFILFRSQEEFVCDSFEEWKEGIAEVNFLDPKDRENSNVENILLDAWNFMALQEAEEERRYDETNGYSEE